jgi:hypothetical protein
LNVNKTEISRSSFVAIVVVVVVIIIIIIIIVVVITTTTTTTIIVPVAEHIPVQEKFRAVRLFLFACG